MLTSFHEPEPLPTRRLSSPSSGRTYPPAESNDDPRQLSRLRHWRRAHWGRSAAWVGERRVEPRRRKADPV